MTGQCLSGLADVAEMLGAWVLEEQSPGIQQAPGRLLKVQRHTMPTNSTGTTGIAGIGRKKQKHLSKKISIEVPKRYAETALQQLKSET